MPGGSTPCLGNQLFEQMVYLSPVTFPTLGANASSSTSVTLKGALPGDIVGWNIQSPPAHLFIENVYVSAADTLSVVWGTDGTGITGSTTSVVFKLGRFQNQSMGLSVLPSALY